MIQTRAQSDALQQRSRPFARVVHGHPPDQQRHRHVLQRREFGQQVMELVDEAKRAIAQLAARSIGQAIDLPPGDRHRSCSRQVQAAEQLQQRGLAGAGRADDRDALAGGDLEIDALEHFDARVALLEVLEQAAAGENEVRHGGDHSCRSDCAGCVRAARQDG